MEITSDQKNLLDNLYYKTDNPSSFRGINALYSAAEASDSTLKLKHIKEWLK